MKKCVPPCRASSLVRRCCGRQLYTHPPRRCACPPGPRDGSTARVASKLTRNLFLSPAGPHKRGAIKALAAHCPPLLLHYCIPTTAALPLQPPHPGYWYPCRTLWYRHGLPPPTGRCPLLLPPQLLQYYCCNYCIYYTVTTALTALTALTGTPA